MKFHAITIDTSNPQSLAEWWAGALGVSVSHDYGNIVQLESSADIPTFQFQKNDASAGHSCRVHADLKTDNLDMETERLVTLGAILINRTELPGFRYVTLSDPDGNQFDLVQF